MNRREMLAVMGASAVVLGGFAFFNELDRRGYNPYPQNPKPKLQASKPFAVRAAMQDYQAIADEARYIIVRPEYTLSHCSNAIKKKSLKELAAKYGSENISKSLSGTMWYDNKPMLFEDFINRCKGSKTGISDFEALMRCFTTGLDIRGYLQETVEFARTNGTFPGEIPESMVVAVQYYNAGMGSAFSNPRKAAEMFYNMIVSAYLDAEIPYSPDSMFSDALPYHQRALQQIGRFGESGIIARAGSAPTLEGFLQELSANQEVYQREFWRSVLFTRLMANCIIKFHDSAQDRAKSFGNVVRVVGDRVFSEVFRTSLDGRELLDGRTFVNPEDVASGTDAVDSYINDLFNLDTCWRRLLVDGDSQPFAAVYRTPYRPNSLKEVVLMGLIAGGMNAYNAMKDEQAYQQALAEAGGRAGDVLANYNDPYRPQTVMRPDQPWKADDSNIKNRRVQTGSGGTTTVTEREIGLSPQEFQRQQQQERINRDPAVRMVRFIGDVGNKVLSPIAPKR